ncbi:hypothetical protein GJAV_G00214180 [Gymnothorax javanicus]|nr:hypothetical protein GJAV_G00214180 [Gymnothorax javanicus]
MQSLLPQSRTVCRNMVLLAILWTSWDGTAFLKACEINAEHQDWNRRITCVTNYWRNLTCELNITGWPLNATLFYQLQFQHCEDMKTQFGCRMMKKGQCLSCSLVAEMEENRTFMSVDEFKVTLVSNTSGQDISLINSTFTPKDHIKPDTPGNLTVIRNSSGYWFTWVSNYESHEYQTFSNELLYKLQYHQTALPYQTTTVHPMEKTVHIDHGNLKPGTEYTAVVCSHPGADYRGEWSEWSPPVVWKTQVPQVTQEDWKFLWNVVLPVCAVVAILTCVTLCPIARSKTKVWSLTPTPAPYFQPLYSHYKGNFRSWLVSQDGPVEPIRMEEEQKIDKVTEALPLQEAESCQVTPTSQSILPPTLYITLGNEDQYRGSPSPKPTLRDTPLPLHLGEMFHCQTLGLENCTCESSSWDPKHIRRESLPTRLDYCTLSALESPYREGHMTGPKKLVM